MIAALMFGGPADGKILPAYTGTEVIRLPSFSWEDMDELNPFVSPKTELYTLDPDTLRQCPCGCDSYVGTFRWKGTLS